MAEQEPLLAPDSHTQFPPPTKKKTLQSAMATRDLVMAIFLPWAIFVLILILFLQSYHGNHDFVWICICMYFCVGLVFVAVGFGRDKSVHLAVGLLCLTACCIGSSIGLFIYDSYGVTYWQLQGGAEYEHVSPASKGSNFADAQVLHFMPDAFVDTERTLGYMEAGTVYCVAPVSAAKFSNAPQYWAAGIDCCQSRSSFKCGDVHHNSQKTALGILSDSERKKYETAIRMAEAVYSLDEKETGRYPIHWISAESSLKDDKWNSMLLYTILSTFLYLLCSAAAAFRIRMSIRDSS